MSNMNTLAQFAEIDGTTLIPGRHGAIDGKLDVSQIISEISGMYIPFAYYPGIESTLASHDTEITTLQETDDQLDVKIENVKTVNGYQEADIADNAQNILDLQALCGFTKPFIYTGNGATVERSFSFPDLAPQWIISFDNAASVYMGYLPNVYGKAIIHNTSGTSVVECFRGEVVLQELVLCASSPMNTNGVVYWCVVGGYIL